MYRHPKDDLQVEEYFSQDEVGLKHPFTGAFVRLCNDGSIQISLGDKGETSLVMSRDGILIYADQIDLITANGGLRWNGKRFNPNATAITEPTLVDTPLGYRNPMKGLDKYGV